MNRGVPPTEEKALTGELTPPGMTAHASAKSFAETSVPCMTTSVPARGKAATTGCSGLARGRDDEHGVIGLAGQPLEVAVDGAARLLAVGGEHGLAGVFGGFPR